MDKIKILLVPIGAIIVIIGLFFVVVQFVLGRITPLNSDLSASQEQADALAQKVSTLSQVDQAHLKQSEAAYLALPDKNPAAIIISQIKNLALNRNLVLTSISVSSTTLEGELGTGLIEIRAEGDYLAAFAFMKDLENMSPLVTVDRSKLTSVTGNEVEMQLSLRSYWSKFPEKLPAITEAVSGLTDEEINVLTQLSQLSQPTFSQLTPENSGTGRGNPFAVE